MPFEVSNPVKFYAGGDDSQAMGSLHCRGARIYDILDDRLDEKSVVVVLSPNTVLKDGSWGFPRPPLEIKREQRSRGGRSCPTGSIARAIDNPSETMGVATPSRGRR